MGAASVDQVKDLRRQLDHERVYLASAAAVMATAVRAIERGDAAVAAHELCDWLRVFRPEVADRLAAECRP